MKNLSIIFLLFTAYFEISFAQVGSTGLIPITELKTSLYKGYQGGLYPNGSNIKTFGHDSLGLAVSRQIMPLDKLGNKDSAKGNIVLLSIGMSNTTQEFSYFKTVVDTSRIKNPRLTLVDGAQGGQTGAIISNPDANFWKVIDQRLQSAGASFQQVQACWLKEADANPVKPFPDHANILLDELIKICRIIKQKYPNCKIIYLSSRIYAGYATSKLNPEPYAYESAFSVKWLIEKQINGDTTLACTGAAPQAPYLEWGPYLWADGLTPRGDGLVWEQGDFQTDGTHPYTKGQKKVSDMLLNFFSTNSTSRNWFLKNSLSHVNSDDTKANPKGFLLRQNYPNPFNPSTTIVFDLPEDGKYSIKIFDSLGRIIQTLADENYSAGSHYIKFDATGLTGGLYYYQLTGRNATSVGKMILLK